MGCPSERSNTVLFGEPETRPGRFLPEICLLCCNTFPYALRMLRFLCRVATSSRQFTSEMQHALRSSSTANHAHTNSTTYLIPQLASLCRPTGQPAHVSGIPLAAHLALAPIRSYASAKKRINKLPRLEAVAVAADASTSGDSLFYSNTQNSFAGLEVSPMLQEALGASGFSRPSKVQVGLC